MAPAVQFDNVSKKFRRGEKHDSLRDLIPAAKNLYRNPSSGAFVRRGGDSMTADTPVFAARRSGRTEPDDTVTEPSS